MKAVSLTSLILIIVFIYLAPLLFWLLYFYYFNIPFHWISAWIGLAIAFLGATLLFTLFSSYLKKESLVPAPAFSPISEPSIIPSITPISSKENALIEENILLSKILEEAKGTKNEQAALIEQLEVEKNKYQTYLQQSQEEANLKENALKQKIEELEQVVHNKQQALNQLENQIYDLRYEIKTLLQLTEVDYHSLTSDIPIPLNLQLPSSENKEKFIPENAQDLSRKCIDIVEKITIGYKSKTINNLINDPYALDLRSLSEALNFETSGLICAYSPKEERLVFANKNTKNFFGWTSSQFIKNFPALILQDSSNWEQAIEKLLTEQQTTLNLNIKNKNGHNTPQLFHLGAVQNGIFRSLIIIVATDNH